MGHHKDNKLSEGNVQISPKADLGRQLSGEKIQTKHNTFIHNNINNNNGNIQNKFNFQ